MYIASFPGGTTLGENCYTTPVANFYVMLDIQIFPSRTILAGVTPRWQPCCGSNCLGSFIIHIHTGYFDEGSTVFMTNIQLLETPLICYCLDFPLVISDILFWYCQLLKQIISHKILAKGDNSEGKYVIWKLSLRFHKNGITILNYICKKTKQMNNSIYMY